MDQLIEVRRTTKKGRGVFALKEIKKEEEITVNYNGEPDDTTPINWFDVEK